MTIQATPTNNLADGSASNQHFSEAARCATKQAETTTRQEPDDAFQLAVNYAAQLQERMPDPCTDFYLSKIFCRSGEMYVTLPNYTNGESQQLKIIDGYFFIDSEFEDVQTGERGYLFKVLQEGNVDFEEIEILDSKLDDAKYLDKIFKQHCLEFKCDPSLITKTMGFMIKKWWLARSSHLPEMRFSRFVFENISELVPSPPWEGPAGLMFQMDDRLLIDQEDFFNIFGADSITLLRQLSKSGMLIREENDVCKWTTFYADEGYVLLTFDMRLICNFLQPLQCISRFEWAVE